MPSQKTPTLFIIPKGKPETGFGNICDGIKNQLERIPTNGIKPKVRAVFALSEKGTETAKEIGKNLGKEFSGPPNFMFIRCEKMIKKKIGEGKGRVEIFQYIIDCIKSSVQNSENGAFAVVLSEDTIKTIMGIVGEKNSRELAFVCRFDEGKKDFSSEPLAPEESIKEGTGLLK